MVFEYYDPPEELSSVVREFWIFENPDPRIVEQKIIPDGYSEIIIHYGDPYEINLTGKFFLKKYRRFRYDWH